MPEVFWICGSHDANVSVSGGMPDLSSPFYVGSPFAAKAWEGKADASAETFYKVVENIQSFLIGGESQKGWKPRDQILLCTPRTDCGAIVVNGTSTPWTFRIFPERAIFTGYQGTGRMGGDYWAKSYHDGCKHSGGAPGFSIMKCLWPGPDGAEPSARFEAMIEGLQELEARIFVEQTLDRGILPRGAGAAGHGAIGPPLQGHLRRRPGLASALESDVSVGVRSRRGRRPGRGQERVHRSASRRRRRRRFKIKLRNWTGKPRRWKAESSEKWIVPARTEGSAKGSEDLEVRINGELLEPEKQSTGVLTVTDVESARAYPVKIAVRTGSRQNPPK